MAKKLYVSGLPYTTTNEELRTLFAEVGAVTSAEIIMDRVTGQSRGFGFVEMPDDAEAESAIERFNNSELGGRRLTVNEARPRTERPPQRRDRGERERRY